MENKFEVQDEEINFSWYYRSDNDPMKINKVNAEWTRYTIDDEIESAYDNYLYAEKKNYSTFEIEKTEYIIDFGKNVQRLKQNSSDQRFIGRFTGDSFKNKNLLDEENFILSEKLYFAKRTNKFYKTSLNSGHYLKMIRIS